jgi:hypothetical protein
MKGLLRRIEPSYRRRIRLHAARSLCAAYPNCLIWKETVLTSGDCFDFDVRRRNRAAQAKSKSACDGENRRRAFGAFGKAIERVT